MRGGRFAVWLCLVLASGCSGQPKPSEPAQPIDLATLFKPPAIDPILERPTPVPAKTEPPRRESSFEDLLKLQKEILARRPQSDEEKLRLALLYASAGNLEEAERVFSTIRTPGKFGAYLDLFLRRELGDHKEASKRFAQFVDEERRATGFVIEKADLCTQVRRYRDTTPAESDRVRPGGQILLYIEPRNFALQRAGDKHILHLRYDWKLYDERSTELPVETWEKAPPEEREDRVIANGPFTEFYQSFKLPIPASLAPGRYRVKVTVTDAVSGRSDSVLVPITVTAEK